MRRPSTAPMSTVSPCAPPTRWAPATARPKLLTLNAEVIACGDAPTLEVAPGTATTIATGGVIPRGADAVVMIEHTELIEGEPPRIEVRRAAAPGPVRLLRRLRHRARRDAASARHARRLARDRHAGGVRPERNRRGAAAESGGAVDRRRTGGAGRAAESRRKSTTATAPLLPPPSPRPAASRLSFGAFPDDAAALEKAVRGGAWRCRHGGAVGRHLEGRRRSLAHHRLQARAARHPGARRRAQARQAALPRRASGTSRSWCCPASRPRRSSPSTPTSRR